MEDKNNYLMTPKEVQEYLKVSPATFHRYINDGDNPLPHAKLSSSCVRIKKWDLDKWIQDKISSGSYKII